MTLVSQGEAIAINREMAADREKAEHYLLAYAEELRKYQDGRREYVSSGRSKKDKSPVEHAVLRGAAYDAQSDAFHWLQAVEIVERGMDGRKLLFLTARRKAEARKGNGFGCGRPGWVAVTQMILPMRWRSNTSRPVTGLQNARSRAGGRTSSAAPSTLR